MAGKKKATAKSDKFGGKKAEAFGKGGKDKGESKKSAPKGDKEK